MIRKTLRSLVLFTLVGASLLATTAPTAWARPARPEPAVAQAPASNQTLWLWLEGLLDRVFVRWLPGAETAPAPGTADKDGTGGLPPGPPPPPPTTMSCTPTAPAGPACDPDG